MTNKLASLVLAMGFLVASLVPARADSLQVYFSSGGSPRYVEHHRGYRPMHHRRHAQPLFLPMPWTNVYERTVYVDRPVAVPTPVVMAPVTLPANAASETYVDSNGRTCREYQTRIVVDGISRSAYGTACLQPDGSWRVVD